MAVKLGFLEQAQQRAAESDMNAMTTQQAQLDLDGLVERVIADNPTILSSNKGHKAVLMSLDEFSGWQETFYLLSNPANASHLLGSIQSAQAGHVIERALIEE